MPLYGVLTKNIKWRYGYEQATQPVRGANFNAHQNILAPSATLDHALVGDIHGAFGTIRANEQAGSNNKKLRYLKTLLAIIGPGLIVMVGDNDAGAFGTYTQAGQNYGLHLMWTLMLLIPVLYAIQEMVLRLGAVSGVGHAKLILERFGKFWGAFSVIDIFILNALTIVTEFIGITLAMSYLGVPKIAGVLVAALIVIAAASTGSFRRFERVCMLLVAGSLLLVPIFVLAHPPLTEFARSFVIPNIPHSSSLSTVMLLIIAIVGTTIAPWQLFFQQSYVIDKRITSKFIKFERVDLWLGIGLVIIGASAMIAFTAAAFGGHSQFGNFVDAGQVAAGLQHYVGRAAGVMFALALLDASIIGAAAVSLSTAYAIGDVLSLKHSLHRRPSEAKGFYAVFVGLIMISAIIVIIPGSPLGLITEGVQTLAGILLPPAAVFLLLLCNDHAVLGPWVNGLRTNIVTSIIIGSLLMMSVILTLSVLFPTISGGVILGILVGGVMAGVILGAAVLLRLRRHPKTAIDRTGQEGWQMPALKTLPTPRLSQSKKLGLGALRGYTVMAAMLVIVRIAQLAITHH